MSWGSIPVKSPVYAILHHRTFQVMGFGICGRKLSRVVNQNRIFRGEVVSILASQLNPSHVPKLRPAQLLGVNTQS